MCSMLLMIRPNRFAGIILVDTPLFYGASEVDPIGGRWAREGAPALGVGGGKGARRLGMSRQGCKTGPNTAGTDAGAPSIRARAAGTDLRVGAQGGTPSGEGPGRAGNPLLAKPNFLPAWRGAASWGGFVWVQ